MSSSESRRDDPDAASVDGSFRAIVERYQNAANQCTIFPADADRAERTTAWISAEAPAFVDLREHR